MVEKLFFQICYTVIQLSVNDFQKLLPGGGSCPLFLPLVSTTDLKYSTVIIRLPVR
jgi:hypothetical protein